jgi:hypothetical protein
MKNSKKLSKRQAAAESSDEEGSSKPKKFNREKQ